MELLKSETLLLRFVLLISWSRRRKHREVTYRDICQEILAFTPDKYENQLLKYFDYTKWMLRKV
jgi:hypothetical protein